MRSIFKNKVVKNAGWVIGDHLTNMLLAFLTGILNEIFTLLTMPFAGGVTSISIPYSEKLYEVMAATEALQRAEALPGFFRICAENRNLNYDNYFSKGCKALKTAEQLSSRHTRRPNVEFKLKLFGGCYE